MKPWFPALTEKIWHRPFRHSLWDLGTLVRTARGRRQIRGAAWFLLWPITCRLAALYRRTLLRRVHVVAVVGTFGKTTTARAISGALGRTIDPRLEHNAIGAAPRAVLRLRPHERNGVIEAGIDGKRQMAPMARTVRPTVTVVTSIGTEHGRSFGSLETARDEKADMVRVLGPSGIAVLNGDDPNVLWMASQTRARVITFGLGEGNQVRASAPKVDWPHGTRFRLHVDGQERDVCVRLLGRHMIYAVLAAVAVAVAEGEALDPVLARLAELAPARGRMAVKQLGNGSVLICDDYKSPLETIHAALDVLAEIPAQRKVVVLGPIGEPPAHQRQQYRAVAARVAETAQLAIFIDSFALYRPGLVQAGMPREAVLDVGSNVLRAAATLRDELGPGDVALIKGRLDQHLERVELVLDGRNVRCGVSSCPSRARGCDTCPMLEEV